MPKLNIEYTATLLTGNPIVSVEIFHCTATTRDAALIQSDRKAQSWSKQGSVERIVRDDNGMVVYQSEGLDEKQA